MPIKVLVNALIVANRNQPPRLSTGYSRRTAVICVCACAIRYIVASEAYLSSVSNVFIDSLYNVWGGFIGFIKSDASC